MVNRSMIGFMTVKTETNGVTEVFEPVEEVYRENDRLLIYTPSEVNKLDSESRVLSVGSFQPDISCGDWIKYIDSDKKCIRSGQVSNVKDKEIIVKQLPNGYQVAIHKEQVFKADTDGRIQ